MKNSFSPSINIIRDQGRDFDYITTPNAEKVLQQLNESITSGFKSFYIVGSFGTGKSAFLLALESQLNGIKKVFNTPIIFNGKTKYETINIVGDFRSLEDSIKESINTRAEKDVIEALDTYYHKISSTPKGLLIVIDEFGKSLEYASQNQPEKELYFLQKLTEYVNDLNKNIILITTLHQNIDTYGNNIQDKKRHEWAKVKGRLKEIVFNEPVEQLLYLAANKLSKKGISDSVKAEKTITNFHKLFRVIENSKVYPLKNHLTEELAKNLFPLDALSAAILTIALQRYGQNERSLFTFLETLTRHQKKQTTDPYFNLSHIYDYLVNNFYSFLLSKYNPDYLKWSFVRNALDRAEIVFEKEFHTFSKIIKTIGLLNIFSQEGAKINGDFLANYGNWAIGLVKTNEIIENLEQKKIIRYRNFSDSYILFEGTDLDIDLALIDAGNHITKNFNTAIELKKYFNFPHALAKATFLKKGTPRFYEFDLSENSIKKTPKGETDGYINLIFADKPKIEEIKTVSGEIKEAILFVVFNNSEKIREILIEIEKINYVITKTIDDRVAQRELKSIKENEITKLNELVIDSLYKRESNITWIFNGEICKVESQRDFSKLLSEICDEIYSATPTFSNELLNREKLPGSITVARKNLLSALLEKWSQEDLGFPKENFPPEKTIYLSLLKNTGMHKKVGDEYLLTEPSDSSFKKLWQCCENFIESSKSNKKSLIELVELLNSKPFKLKQGLIDFWLPIFLFIKRDDYALFDKETFIPFLNGDLFDLIIKYPQHYSIKAFDIQGVKFDLFNKYRTFINKGTEAKITNQSFVDTIRPFLTFYRGLPEYTKRTDRLSKTAIALRNTIANAKELEKTFFEDFPSALGYTSNKLYNSDKYLEDFVIQLQKNIREIRTCHEELINRIESRLLEIIGNDKLGFVEYKNILINRYYSIKQYLFLPYQKTFYQRLISPLDERMSWLNSIVQSLIDKNLEQLNDDEEELVYEKLGNILKEFDNLCDFSKLGVDKETEDAVRLEITLLAESPQKVVIRLPKKKLKQAKSLEDGMRKQLVSDKLVNQSVLIKLLKEQIEND